MYGSITGCLQSALRHGSRRHLRSLWRLGLGIVLLPLHPLLPLLLHPSARARPSALALISRSSVTRKIPFPCAFADCTRHGIEPHLPHRLRNPDRPRRRRVEGIFKHHVLRRQHKRRGKEIEPASSADPPRRRPPLGGIRLPPLPLQLLLDSFEVLHEQVFPCQLAHRQALLP